LAWTKMLVSGLVYQTACEELEVLVGDRDRSLLDRTVERLRPAHASQSSGGGRSAFQKHLVVVAPFAGTRRQRRPRSMSRRGPPLLSRPPLCSREGDDGVLGAGTDGVEQGDEGRLQPSLMSPDGMCGRFMRAGPILTGRPERNRELRVTLPDVVEISLTRRLISSGTPP